MGFSAAGRISLRWYRWSGSRHPSEPFLRG